MELSAGTRVGPYEIQRRVGAGGMGIVYGAVDSRLGRSVAIKVLPAELVGDEDRLRRFEKEARTIGALNHPNLVTLHDVGHHDGAPFLVTELLTGSSLRNRLAQRKLALRDAISYAKDIARGLAAAHGAGVVHRDIKPDNIFITEDDRVKILDFGIAKLRRDEPATADIANAATLGNTAATGTGVVIGTPGYMAPEQLAGTAVDARTDLFALGVVLYEMVSGRRPFAADTNVEESYAIMKSPPSELPAAVPAGVARVVMRCLEKRPDARFQTAADLAFALEALGDIARDSASSLERSRRSDRALDAARSPDDVSTAQSADAVGALATLPADASRAQPAAPVTATRPRRSRFLLLALVAALALAIVGALAAIKLTRSPRVTTSVPTPAAQPFFALADGGPVYRRVSYRSQQGWFARFAADGRILYSMRERDYWEVVQHDPAHASVVPLGIHGRLLAVAPSGEYALLNKDDALITQVPGVGPRERARQVSSAAYGPDGALAIIRTEGTTDIIEYPIGTEIRRDSNRAFSHLSISPDGKHLAFIEHDAFPDTRGRVLVVDMRNQQRAASKIYPDVEGVAWSHEGELLFSEASRLHSLELAGRDRVVLHGTLTLQLRDVARDGRLLFAPADYRLHAYVGPIAGEQRAVGWFDGAVMQSLSRDGSVFAFLLGTGVYQSDDGYACFVRSGDAAPVPIGHGFQVALVPDGSAAVVLTAKQTLQWQPIGPGATRTIAIAPVALDLRAHLQITADAKRVIAYGAKPNEPKRLWSIDLDGAAPPAPFGPALDSDISDPRNFIVSPDAAWIAFPVGPEAAKPGVRLVAATGDARIDLPAAAERTPLRFSQDGKALLVIDYAPWPTVIERIDVASKAITRVGRLGDGERPAWLQPAMSDDTRTVGFSIPRKTSDLYVLEPPPTAKPR
ncbi:MAG TPA: serine/threonine-protein kinase [Kofleriaceae bacterium]